MSDKQVSSPWDFLPIGVFLIFLTLKLCGVIDWSWWWVTAPLWMPFVLAWTLLIIVWGITRGKW